MTITQIPLVQCILAIAVFMPAGYRSDAHAPE